MKVILHIYFNKKGLYLYKKITMALSKKREYNVISGIEDREETNKRIRKYLYKQFKQQPEKLFLEWDKRKIIIENCQSWAFPEPTKKVAIFLNFTTPKI